MPVDGFPPAINKTGPHTGTPAGAWNETLPESPANLHFVFKSGDIVPRSLNPARQKGEEAWLHVSKNSEIGYIAFVWKDSKRSMANGRFVTYYDGYNEADAKSLAAQNYDAHEEALKREFNKKVALTIVRSRLAWYAIRGNNNRDAPVNLPLDHVPAWDVCEFVDDILDEEIRQKTELRDYVRENREAGDLGLPD